MSLSTVSTSAVTPIPSVVTVLAAGNPLGGLDARPVNSDEWEKERTALYHQLDEKVFDNIFHERNSYPVLIAEGGVLEYHGLST